VSQSLTPLAIGRLKENTGESEAIRAEKKLYWSSVKNDVHKMQKTVLNTWEEQWKQ